MRSGTWFYVVAYWAIGIAGGLLFRQGGVTESLRWWCFIGGNALGITSTWFLMRVYASMTNVNVATVLCSAGSFVLFQFILWEFFRAQLSALQWMGVALTAAGTVLAVIQTSPEERPVRAAVPEGREG